MGYVSSLAFRLRRYPRTAGDKHDDVERSGVPFQVSQPARNRDLPLVDPVDRINVPFYPLRRRQSKVPRHAPQFGIIGYLPSSQSLADGTGIFGIGGTGARNPKRQQKAPEQNNNQSPDV